MDLFPFTNSEGTKEMGVIPASYANFGFVPYGHSMVSILYSYRSVYDLWLELV